jgi:hypothetical protein
MRMAHDGSAERYYRDHGYMHLGPESVDAGAVDYYHSH